MIAKVLVPVADGTEELEAVSIIDVLRRAGDEVTVASVDGLQITASRGVKLVADRLIGQCLGETYNLIALPGGVPGVENLRDSADLKTLLGEQARSGRLYAAICAAPAVVLATHGLLADRQATGHPGFIQLLPDPTRVADRVVVDGNCVTSRAAGTAMEFALKLVEILHGPAAALDLGRSILAPGF